ncbi:MAG: hypothetical protein LBR52_01125 [Prevotellaceae bacterium]|jgi:hypothetical protein|nr:hypothetical protein [Prevotellaceae bacterium]
MGKGTIFLIFLIKKISPPDIFIQLTCKVKWQIDEFELFAILCHNLINGNILFFISNRGSIRFFALPCPPFGYKSTIFFFLNAVNFKNQFTFAGRKNKQEEMIRKCTDYDEKFFLH